MIELEYQLHPRNCNLIMTWPKWQMKPDTIGMYGCLVTAKTNAARIYHNDRDLLIQDVNSYLRDNMGYYYQRYRYNKNAKMMCYNQESFVFGDVINRKLGIDLEDPDYKGKIDIKSPTDYYIVRTNYNETGHYSLLMSETSYYDSYDGKIKELKDYLNIRMIRFSK